jgi:hypothetical protein
MDPILHKKASVAENKIALVSKALYIYIYINYKSFDYSYPWFSFFLVITSFPWATNTTAQRISKGATKNNFKR